ncbi:MAG: glycosyltransferase family 2 protein [Gammaproteobacteria bacterium]|nr:glycosyltransferase family 2 protein [Gammaproteobacteria bacterium]
MDSSERPILGGLDDGDTPLAVTVVVPLYNEADSVPALVAELRAAMAQTGYPWEIILVDDGSTDATPARLEAVLEADADDRFRVLTLQRNFGQTAAMQAGIDHATGSVIVTMDGDLQNDPADIPRLVERLVAEDLDLLVGWRRHRRDNLWLRIIPSRLANRLIGNVTGVELHDYGCSLKVYRGSVIKRVRLFGDMHRFIPAWVSVHTSPTRIKEEVVNHRARLHGASNYGLTRAFRVVVDLLSVYFFIKYLSRPGHFFGRIGLAFGGAGGLILAYLAYAKLVLGEDIGTRPLLMLGILLVVVAVQFLTTGVLGELGARTYFATSATLPYVVRRDSHRVSRRHGAAAPSP